MKSKETRTAIDLADEALFWLAKSEGAEESANARRQVIEDKVRRELSLKKKAYTERDVQSITDFRASQDPQWQMHVANNQYYDRKITRYTMASQAKMLLEVNSAV